MNPWGWKRFPRETTGWKGKRVKEQRDTPTLMKGGLLEALNETQKAEGNQGSMVSKNPGRNLKKKKEREGWGG